MHCVGACKDHGEVVGEPEQILEVAWLDGVPVSEGAARIHRDQISRRQFPLNEALVTSWIQENAHAQSVPVRLGNTGLMHALYVQVFEMYRSWTM